MNPLVYVHPETYKLLATWGYNKMQSVIITTVATENGTGVLDVAAATEIYTMPMEDFSLANVRAAYNRYSARMQLSSVLRM